DRYRPARPVGRSHEAQPPALLAIGKSLLFIAGRNTRDVRLYPYLQEMRSLIRGMVELAVLNALAGAHALNVPRGDALDVAQCVLVREVAFEHVADDFHVPMAVRAK